MNNSPLALAFTLFISAIHISTPILGQSLPTDEVEKQKKSLGALSAISTLTQEQMFSAVRSTASRYGLNINPQSPTPCGHASGDVDSYHFCEYEVFKTRLGFWSRKLDAPVIMITARPFSHALSRDWHMALSLVIATIDPELSEPQIQDMVSRLVTPDRSLTGTVTEIGKVGLYMTRIGKKGITFMAGSMPSR